jgi:hypothetical protein
LTETKMALNNDGNEVVLVDAGGTVRSRVTYTGDHARTGARVEFGQ